MNANIAAILYLVAVLACVPMNESFTARDLVCHATPEDACIRVADFVTRDLPAEVDGTLRSVTVAARYCDVGEIGDVRCWSVESEVLFGRVDRKVHEHADGTLGYHDPAVGSRPPTSVRRASDSWGVTCGRAPSTPVTTRTSRVPAAGIRSPIAWTTSRIPRTARTPPCSSSGSEPTRA